MKSKITTLNESAEKPVFSIKFRKQTGKIHFVLLLTILLLSKGLYAQTVITIKDADLGTGTYNWTNNNIYLLDGFVYLEAGGILNIQEGTAIKGKASPTTSDNASALIITVGAKINAIGTAGQPVIFTSEIDDLSDPADLSVNDRGLWGGLILLGDGILGNSTTKSNIEGIPTTELRAKFGGNNNANNAGTLKYVSIRHGGAELAPGDEINGLTLGGVGSGTTIEHIEVLSNLDDGIEIFGGAVNIKYASIGFCNDDGFDWDLGWVGKGQFWFVIQGTEAADNGGEWDGAIPDNQTPYSNPTVYNLTFIGSGTGSVAAKNTNAILMRDATGGTVANSIFTEYAHKALEIEDLPAGSGTDSYARMQNGNLKILNNIWYGFSTYSTFDANPETGIIRFTSGGDDTACTALITHLTNNNNQLTDPMLNSISRLPDGKLDPRPKTNSPALNGLTTYPSDAFFTKVSYRGAFDAVGTPLWISGWTALDEYGYLSGTTSINDMAMSDFNMKIYPNPVGNTLTIEYTINKDEQITFELFDINGRKVSEIGNKWNTSGNHKIKWNTEFLTPGVYVLKASLPSTTYVKRFIAQ